MYTIAAITAYINVQQRRQCTLMYSKAAMTVYIRYTLVVYIAFQRIDREHDCFARRRKFQFHFERISPPCSVRSECSERSSRCVRSEPVSFKAQLFVDCYWWDFVVVLFALCGSSPRQEYFPHGCGEEKFRNVPLTTMCGQEILWPMWPRKTC